MRRSGAVVQPRSRVRSARARGTSPAAAAEGGCMAGGVAGGGRREARGRWRPGSLGHHRPRALHRQTADGRARTGDPVEHSAARREAARQHELVRLGEEGEDGLRAMRREAAADGLEAHQRHVDYARPELARDEAEVEQVARVEVRHDLEREEVVRERLEPAAPRDGAAGQRPLRAAALLLGELRWSARGRERVRPALWDEPSLGGHRREDALASRSPCHRLPRAASRLAAVALARRARRTARRSGQLRRRRSEGAAAAAIRRERRLGHAARPIRRASLRARAHRLRVADRPSSSRLFAPAQLTEAHLIF